ncbi:hypothetical protein IFU23_16485 [Pantoea agglomerans]|uniref:hypothetical protein n=1 Tax=Enterobacter agglomerans TaxID=549 RepID=UPI00077AFA5A|nr:hypothetical protein [Pantoea agglomerans]MBD8159690.1 hypothetical protein [Pantoea agglomerans]MBD8231951.1 hypothetical protein [Pantoea agglomerans]
MEDKFNYHYIYEQNVTAPSSIDLYNYGFFGQYNFNNDNNIIITLQHGFSNLATTIANSGNDSLSDGIWLALIGAISAFLFNVVQKWLERSSVRLTKSGEATLILIKELEFISIEYWLKGYAPSEREKILFSEINIKAMLITLNANILTIIDNLPYKNKEKTANKLRVFSSDIFDLTSGGDFESMVRLPDNRTASAIARKCSDAKAMILKLI